MTCTVEIWERKGERETQYTPACLKCSWIGSDTSYADAVAEGEMHVRGERQPWQIAPGEVRRAWAPSDQAD